MTVKVRKATAADATALAGLRWRWPVEERGYAGTDRATFLEVFSAWLVEHLATHLPFMAEVDDQTVGMAWLMLADRVPDLTRWSRRTGDVQSVYVVPELRNRGVGAQLVEAVLTPERLEHALFPLGETQVTCTATDRAGNTSTQRGAR